MQTFCGLKDYRACVNIIQYQALMSFMYRGDLFSLQVQKNVASR